jgi:hypothetical protein
MELARNILLGLHLLGTAGILVSLLLSRRKLSPGIIHSALLSLVTGVALVGLRYPLVEADPMKWEEIDNIKISVKFLILLVILFFSYIGINKKKFNAALLSGLTILSLLNVSIAFFW